MNASGLPDPESETTFLFPCTCDEADSDCPGWQIDGTEGELLSYWHAWRRPPRVSLRQDGRRGMSAQVESLTSRLRRIAATAPGQLTDMESRLVKLTVEFLREVLIVVRCEGAKELSDVRPVDPSALAEAARLAFACAVEVEQPLREIRSRMEAR
jgi:hypothetical protein